MDLFQLLIFPIIVVTLIPVYYFAKLYRKTQLKDFLIFAIAYSMVPIAGVSYFVILDRNLLILHQVIQLSLITAYALVMLLIIRIVWGMKLKKFHYLGFIWYVLLILLVSMFKLHQQPDKVKYGSFEFRHTYSPYHPDGASTILGKTIIYSTSHFLIGLLFILFVLIMTLYGIYNFAPVSPSNDILRVKKTWFNVMFIHTIGWLFYFPEINTYAGFGQLLIFISHLGTAYLVIRNPELVLINQAQVVRAYHIYEDILKLQDSTKVEEYGVKSIVRYLNSLPEDVLSKLNL
ncbi:MAG: hypothetical protein ACW99A_06725 [Candidatus Kariarchaeaceae archaeon]